MNKQEAIGACKLLKAIIEVGSVEKILGTFIKALREKSILKEDGNWYLHGSFNIGGTVSGRLSSSSPNLQNLPSGSQYGKLIKSCFQSNKDWVFIGADSDSLEDKISALQTKDPNKLKVYIEGYDGHALRAFYYQPLDFPGIDASVESINSIKQLHGALRDGSKSKTFLLTYMGGVYGLMNTCGLTKEDATRIYDNYHKLYIVSDEWVNTQLDQASLDGYVTCAFGLRVRTPILSKTLRDSKYTPREAAAEGRTAGNALGQSYGMLNNRAAIDFMGRVRASRYKYDIKPVGLIHDAIYLQCRNTLGCLKFVNDNLIECMSWQELPELQHDIVKLSAELDLFPDWSKPITLKNNLTIQEINQTIKESHEPA